jgi:hypothetical protein
VRTATHPATVKKLMAESGIYDSVVPNILSQVNSISTSYGDISTADPAIQKAAKVSLPPMYIQQNTDLAIDNVYQWLDGKIPQPNFKIDLTGAKVLFANNIADVLQKRLVALPPCTLAQSRAIAESGNFNAENATCLPAGISVATIAEQSKSSIINQQDFLKNLNIDSASIKNNQGQPVFEQPLVKNIPVQYQRAKKTPMILSVLTLLCGLGVVFLSASWQKGLRHIGINLLVIGLIMLVFSWVFNRTVSTNIVPKVKVDNAIFQQDLRSLITDVSQQIDKNYWYFGGLYTALGAAAIVGAEIFMRRASPTAIATPGKTSAKNSTPAANRRPRP